jgi:hypothetical protein
MVEDCTTHPDVERVWQYVSWWGPTAEDVESLSQSSKPFSGLQVGAEKLRRLVRSVEDRCL